MGRINVSYFTFCVLDQVIHSLNELQLKRGDSLKSGVGWSLNKGNP
jgi:hypothetical protein